MFWVSKVMVLGAFFGDEGQVVIVFCLEGKDLSEAMDVSYI